MAILIDGELVLYGFVGENYWGDGFTARDILDALAEVGRDTDITVRINSGGGYVDDGIAIYNALSVHKGKVTIVVDSMAASSASIIAMAGDERIMRKGSMLMIHDPSGGVWGTAADMDRLSKVMEKYAENLAGIYAEATGEDAADIRADMKSELWMTADEAVERGFATAINDNKARAAAAHDYRVYAHAPERLVALSTRKNWSHSEAGPHAMASATATHRRNKETPMTDKSKADDNVADAEKAVTDAVAKAQSDAKARIKAITECEDAKGREALARHFAFDTDLAPEAAIAAMKAAPSAQAAPADPVADYETQRLAASGMAVPGSGTPPKARAALSQSAIFAARRAATSKGE